MAYIGKDPAQFKRALHEKDTFTGDGSTVTFDLTSDASSANEIQVFVDNVRQEPGASDAYTLGEDDSGNLRRITFTAAPGDGAEIYVLNPKTIDSNLIVPSDGSVTEAKIVTDAVTSTKIGTGAVTSTKIGTGAVTSTKIGTGAVTSTKIGTGAVTSTKILDGTIVNADINACAAISDTKLGTISTACKVATSAISQPGSSSVYLAGDGNWGAIDTSQQETNAFNISLLGFKMAVNEGLTVFNLVDGVVDEFNDESGTDEAEGSNDYYCGTTDFYTNNFSCTPYSAGFTTTTITEPDTSTAGTNPAFGSGTFGQFTVPACMTSVGFYLWGSGGGVEQGGPSGGGGFTSGCLAVTPGQVLEVVVGEGGAGDGTPLGGLGGGGGNSAGSPYDIAAPGGGLSGIFTNDEGFPALQRNAPKAPQVFGVAGGGGGAGFTFPASKGGAAGGTQGNVGGITETAQTSNSGTAGGGGSQTQGGQSNSPSADRNGDFLRGGCGGASCSFNAAGGGAGYYGGGGGFWPTSGPGGAGGGGGGGSSYFGHPQVTCGTTEGGGGLGTPQVNNSFNYLGGGTSSPFYVPGTNEGFCGPKGAGEDGYVLLTASVGGFATPGGGSSTIVSNTFTSTSVATSARIVVFEENVDTPTLNTDIIASVSRDGTNFTNATLTDSGYVTGSSGQRILTGQADISGQPSGQSMRWKLALANNTVKIHGVSLQWA